MDYPKMDPETAKSINAQHFVTNAMQTLSEFQVSHLKAYGVAVLDCKVTIEVFFETKTVKYIPQGEFKYDQQRHAYLQEALCVIMGQGWTLNVDTQPTDNKRASGPKAKPKRKSRVRKLGKSRRSKSRK